MDRNESSGVLSPIPRNTLGFSISNDKTVSEQAISGHVHRPLATFLSKIKWGDTESQAGQENLLVSTDHSLTSLSRFGDSSSLFHIESPNTPISGELDYKKNHDSNTTPERGIVGSGSFSSPYHIEEDGDLTHLPISSFIQRVSDPMVKEREPPRIAPSPAKASQPTQRASGPEFGKTTSLESPLRSAVFNVPKAQKARPEHHRPNPNAQPRELPAEQGFIDPFQPRPPVHKHLAHRPAVDQDIVEISRPLAPPAWIPSNSSHPASYSSFAAPTTKFLPFVSLPKYAKRGDLVDLTDTALFEDKFGAPDPYDYVDAKKAEENIKALLSGVLEDEEDKPRTRGRKNRSEETTAGIADKLGGLKVQAKGDGKEEVEGEEEEDDGTVEGLKVKLLPHQVNGVAWMRDKEAGMKKKNGVLPKGGILADDVR